MVCPPGTFWKFGIIHSYLWIKSRIARAKCG
jgi:hypothetical protein